MMGCLSWRHADCTEVGPDPNATDSTFRLKRAHNCTCPKDTCAVHGECVSDSCRKYAGASCWIYKQIGQFPCDDGQVCDDETATCVCQPSFCFNGTACVPGPVDVTGVVFAEKYVDDSGALAPIVLGVLGVSVLLGATYRRTRLGASNRVAYDSPLLAES